MATPTQNPVPSNIIQFPRISIDQELLEGSLAAEFLGTIAKDEWVDSEHGPQWHLAVKPTDIKIGGGTGWLHTWYKPSTQKNSKMGAALAGLKQVFDGKTLIGEHSLEGQVCWWVRKDLPFGEDKNTGEQMIAKQVLIPTRTADPADTSRSVTVFAPNGASPVPAGQAPPVAAPESYTPEQVDLILAVLDGKAKSFWQIAAARSQLPPELKAAITTGDAIRWLEMGGLIQIDDEGVLHTV